MDWGLCGGIGGALRGTWEGGGLQGKMPFPREEMTRPSALRAPCPFLGRVGRYPAQRFFIDQISGVTKRQGKRATLGPLHRAKRREKTPNN